MDPLQEPGNAPRQESPLGSRRSANKDSTPGSRQRSLLQSALQANTGNGVGRRKSRLQGRSLASDLENQGSVQANILDPEQVAALYQQCIKLATENKITSKNTWALGLIDHLHDLVQPNEQEGSTTNFQRASLTLGAGVEIYAKRVDSVHTEAFKVLGGLSRGGAAAAEDGEQDGEDDAEGGDGQEGEEGARNAGRAARRAAMLRDVNPSSTLESSFEALNVKKFDLAFTVDPLFHKTSAQFDEGGAKGLLLNNLSVFRGCEIIFDSQDIPDTQHGGTAQQPDVQLDLAPLRSQIAQATGESSWEARICPAMDELHTLLGLPLEQVHEAEAERLVASVPDCDRPMVVSGATNSATAPMDSLEDMEADAHAPSSDDEDGPACIDDEGFHGDDAGMMEDAIVPPSGKDPAWMTQLPYESQASVPEDGSVPTFGEEASTTYAGGGEEEADAPSTSEQPSTQERSSNADAVQWLVSGVENLNLDGKAWAGASHWRFRTRQNLDARPELADAQPKLSRQSGASKRGQPLDFNNLPELPEHALALADKKDITLKTLPSKAPTLLPEDLHYKAASLAALFLKPGCPLFEESPQTQQPQSSPAAYDSDDNTAAEYFDDHGGHCEGGYKDAADGSWGDLNHGEAGDLIEAPRKVAQIGINYARASKQVDVRALKQTLWQVIGNHHDQATSRGVDDAELSFQDVLASLSPDNTVGKIADLSVHLCFICVLHLANENGLRITGVPSLDQMAISGVPKASVV